MLDLCLSKKGLEISVTFLTSAILLPLHVSSVFCSFSVSLSWLACVVLVSVELWQLLLCYLFVCGKFSAQHMQMITIKYHFPKGHSGNWQHFILAHLIVFKHVVITKLMLIIICQLRWNESRGCQILTSLEYIKCWVLCILSGIPNKWELQR